MIKHNLILALRSFKRYTNVFLINLLGLSVGLASAFLLYLWIASELNVDKFNQNDERLYQVMQNIYNENEILTLENTPGYLAKTIAEDFPEVEMATSVVSPTWFSTQGVVNYKEINVKAKPQFAEPQFFKMFSFKIIEGDKSDLLIDKNSVLISEELARKLFGTTENVLGKNIKWKRRKFSGDYMISGIFEVAPTSSEPFDVVFPYELFLENYPHLQDWRNSDPSTYVLLKKKTDVKAFEEKLSELMASKNPHHKSTLFLRQFSEKYLYGLYEEGKQAGGRIYVHKQSILAINNR